MKRTSGRQPPVGVGAPPGSTTRRHLGTAPCDPRAASRSLPADVDALLALQQAAGNRAVARALDGPTITLPSPGSEHPLAASLARSDTRFRLPTFADLKAVYKDRKLKIPESVVQQSVAQLLGRMAREKRLKSKEPVPVILKRIFPAPGVISEAEFTKALDVSDRRSIYKTVFDADTAVRKPDRAKLKAAIRASAQLIAKAEGDTAGLKAVFGAKHAEAKANYARARASLGEVSRDMSTKISTDYNLDDPEVFLGGWASHGARHMHLLASIVKVIDADESKATLVHEASHLADASVDDHGYYGSPGFEALDEATKVANAGHYEELPRRQLGTSSYAGLTFTPGVKKSGGAMTWEDTIRRSASEHLRKAWDAGVDAHTWLRGVRKAGLRGDRSPFDAERSLILEVSRLMDLTVHHQQPARAKITALDVTLTESIARGVGLVGQLAGREPVPRLMGPWQNPGDEDVATRYVVIANAIASYGQLLGDPARDMRLIDWLVAHYRTLP